LKASPARFILRRRYASSSFMTAQRQVKRHRGVWLKRCPSFMHAPRRDRGYRQVGCRQPESLPSPSARSGSSPAATREFGQAQCRHHRLRRARGALRYPFSATRRRFGDGAGFAKNLEAEISSVRHPRILSVSAFFGCRPGHACSGWITGVRTENVGPCRHKSEKKGRLPDRSRNISCGPFAFATESLSTLISN